MNYTTKMGNGTDPDQAYDYNGNIKTMTQFGGASQFGWKHISVIIFVIFVTVLK